MDQQAQAQLVALQQENAALQQQMMQMAAAAAPPNSLITRVIQDRLRNLKWREHEKDGKIADTIQQFDRITAMQPNMLDHDKRILLIGVFEPPAALTIDAALMDANLAARVATYAGLRQFALDSFERQEDKRAAVSAILNGKFLKRGQTLRKFGEELLALQAQIPANALGQSVYVQCLTNALIQAGKKDLARMVQRAGPATLAEAVNIACEYDYSSDAPAAAAGGAPNNGPAPMELGAVQATAGAATAVDHLTPLVANITQQTLETTFAALGIRGRFERGRTPPRRGGSSSGWQNRGRQDSWQHRGSNSSSWRPRSQSRDSRSRSAGRSDRDPTSHPAWPVGVRRTPDLLRQLVTERKCFLCFQPGHAWQNCSDPRYDPKGR